MPFIQIYIYCVIFTIPSRSIYDSERYSFVTFMHPQYVILLIPHWLASTGQSMQILCHQIMLRAGFGTGPNMILFSAPLSFHLCWKWTGTKETFMLFPLLQASLWQVPCVPRPVWAWGAASLLPSPSPPSPSLQSCARPGPASHWAVWVGLRLDPWLDGFTLLESACIR